MSKKISIYIVIPALNEERFISKIIESIKTAISYLKEKEQINTVIVDNGSTDKTKKIVNQFKNEIKNLYLVSEKRQGTGWARRKGMRFALDNYYANHDFNERHFCWIICTDADAKVPKNWLKRWMAVFNSLDHPAMIAGSAAFDYLFEKHYPNIAQILNTVGKRIEIMEKKFGVINVDGFHCAIERRCYERIGPYEQPSIKQKDKTVNLAGEDWDLSTKCRKIGFKIIRTKKIPKIIVSARRLMSSPQSYLTGRSYEGEFATVTESDKKGKDLDKKLINPYTRLATLRQSMHYACKPILIDGSILKRKTIKHLLGQETIHKIETWIVRERRFELMSERNKFILRYLKKFHKEFGKIIVNKLFYKNE